MSGITDHALVQNWPNIKHKKVIWRTIGQSTPATEAMLAPLVKEGLKIVRYSPKEQNIPGFIGMNAIIRFSKDEDELQGWTGHDKRVINFSQSLKGRGNNCHYSTVLEALSGYPGAKVYGTGNDDLGPLNGGRLPWDLMKGKLRDSRVFFCAGTWPASYTLSFIEAWMTGIPVVAIGKNLAEDIPGIERFPFYEVHEFIENGVNGFVSDDVGTLRSYIYQLLTDDELAKRIGENGRKTAIQLFSKRKIKGEWQAFLDSLNK